MFNYKVIKAAEKNSEINVDEELWFFKTKSVARMGK